MRALPLCLLLTSLSGCISFGGPTGPGSIPGDAFGAMYSTRSPEQLAACVAATLGSPARQDGDRMMVMSPAQKETYDIGTNTRDSLYPTEVILRGQPNAVEEQQVGMCLSGSSLPS